MEKRNEIVKYSVIALLVILLVVLGGGIGYLAAKRLSVTQNSEVIDKNVTVTSEESVIIDVVKKTQDSVVSIAVSQLTMGNGGVIDKSNTIGTGFIVDSSGLIITNQHVVARNADYKVVTSDGKEYDVSSIFVDNVNDIALLKINAEGLKAVKLGNSDNLTAGQLVIAIGNPLGEFAGTVTTGVLSGLNRTVSTGADFFGSTAKTYYGVLQTDAAINPGNSGGPLLNSSGEVIGVNFATTSGADNISFALPVNIAKQRIDEYRKFGKFVKPYIGVEYEMISPINAKIYGVEPGALVVRVVQSSPASKAGLKRQDIITKINDTSLTNVSLANVVGQYKVGDSLELTVVRDTKEVKIKVVLEEAK